MRRLTIAALVAALPAVASAQSRALPRVGAPLPSIGLPLARITPTLPSIGLPLATPDTRTPQPPARHPGHGGRGHHGGRGRTAIVFVPYGFASFDSSRELSRTEKPSYHEPAARDSSVRERADGTLRLEVEPAALIQVYVDGYFVGTPADVNGELALEAGAHRLELRAPGYETLTVDVRVTANGSATYRASLSPVGGGTGATAGPPPAAAPSAAAPPAAAPAPAPAARRTIYLIPGCYLGNVPPADAGLPSTCDQSRVTTFEP